jgi:hypothetical protein
VCEFVDQRIGQPVLGEVNGFEISAAAIATFHPNVGKALGSVDRKLGMVLLATGRANDPPKIPFR